MAIEHNLQTDYQQTFLKTENDNRIPFITIPIVIGENTFTTLCLLEHRGSVQQCFIHHPSMPTGT
jgi:hypothetical protein